MRNYIHSTDDGGKEMRWGSKEGRGGAAPRWRKKKEKENCRRAGRSPREQDGETLGVKRAEIESGVCVCVRA